MAKTKQYDKGNKGEWSEVYVFFHLLGAHKIYPCDENLVKRGNSYPVLEIIRTDNKAGKQHFILNGTSVRWDNSNNKISVDVSKCALEAQQLLASIKAARGRSFAIPKSYNFLCSLGCASIKADKNQKEDITLVIDDSRSGKNPACGFSIKSYLGQKPTLLNASQSCCFWYQIKNINQSKIRFYDTLTPAQLIPEVYKDNGEFEYRSDTKDGETFRSNLRYIDTMMPELMSELILYAYNKNIKHIDKLVPAFAREKDIFGIGDVIWYEYKVKKVLEAAALGMTPAKPWRGEEDANGGFIAVKSTGEVVTYHIYDRQSLLDYLYHNTSIEHADMTKNNYGKIKTNHLTNEHFYKYVLQIRFR